jgi:acetyltransferase
MPHPHPHPHPNPHPPEPAPAAAAAAAQHPMPPHSIDHYPVRSIDVFRSALGVRFVLRPVLPQDGPALGAMFGRLSRMAHYNRFHGARAQPTEDELRSMTQVDYRRHMALVITTGSADDGHEIIVGDARYVVESEGGRAEAAIVVDDAWQRMGLGERALRALADAARREGLRCVYGGVLNFNAPMLALARRCGFQLACDPGEAGVMRARKVLADEPAASATGVRTRAGDRLRIAA